MDPSSTFYQTLVSTSFTMLGIWFAVMQFGHGGWRTDSARHRATLHIALHFFLPGMLGLGSLLASSADGGLLWRTTFVVGGLIGVTESLLYLRTPVPWAGPVERLIRAVDPVLYLLLVVAAFLPKDALRITPLQAEGIVTGLLFMFGLCMVWLAFAEASSKDESSKEEPSTDQAVRER